MHRRRGNFFSRIRKLRWNSVTTAITVARVKYFNTVQSECLSFCDIDDGSLGHSGGIVFSVCPENECTVASAGGALLSFCLL